MMEKLSYSNVEAAHYWWKDSTETFVENGYTVSKEDKWKRISLNMKKWVLNIQIGLIGMQIWKSEERDPDTS